MGTVSCHLSLPGSRPTVKLVTAHRTPLPRAPVAGHREEAEHIPQTASVSPRTQGLGRGSLGPAGHRELVCAWRAASVWVRAGSLPLGGLGTRAPDREWTGVPGPLSPPRCPLNPSSILLVPSQHRDPACQSKHCSPQATCGARSPVPLKASPAGAAWLSEGHLKGTQGLLHLLFPRSLRFAFLIHLDVALNSCKSCVWRGLCTLPGCLERRDQP